MKNKKILPIIVSVIAMLSVICISSFTREKPPKKQNDINNIAALSSKATADTPESDEKCVACGYHIWSFLWKMKAQKHKKRLKINLPK